MKNPEPIQKAAAIVISAIVIAALLFPVRQNWVEDPEDGFPLSYYPMFTNLRGETTVVHHAMGVTTEGQHIYIPAGYAGAGGMNTNRRQIRKMVREGRADELAEIVAQRLASSRRERDANVTRVDIVESIFNIDAFFRGQTAPVSRVVHASLDFGLGGQP